MPQSMQRAACFLLSSSGNGRTNSPQMLDALLDRLIVTVGAFELEESR